MMRPYTVELIGDLGTQVQKTVRGESIQDAILATAAHLEAWWASPETLIDVRVWEVGRALSNPT